MSESGQRFPATSVRPSQRPPVLQPETPSRMLARLWLRSTWVALAAGAGSLAFQVRWELAAGALMLVSVLNLLLLRHGQRRTSPVFRAIGQALPSPAALRDVYLAPQWLAAVQFVLFGMAGVAIFLVGFALGPSWGPSWSPAWGPSWSPAWGPPWGEAPSAGSLAAALLFLSAGGISGLWLSSLSRIAFQRWLQSFPARELETQIHFTTASRWSWFLGGVALSLSAFIGFLWLLGTPPSGVPLPVQGWLLLIPVVSAAAGGALGAWLSRPLDEDIDRLIRHLSQSDAEHLLPTLNLEEPLAGLASDLRARADQLLRSASEEDSATRSIRDLQRQKMMFMASTGHDLRSPLNSILGFSELLSSEPESLTEGQQESLQTIKRSGEELLLLLNEILEAARIETGHLTLAREWVPAVELLTRAIEAGERHIDHKTLKIVAELQPGLPPVFVDRDRILQAVGCLLRHAGRSMDAGTIRLKAHVVKRSSDPHLRIEVIDSSEALRPEDRERIFEAFREVALPSGRRVGGLGLALSLARSLVVAHGGDVSAETHPNVGTTFTISIPIGDARAP